MSIYSHPKYLVNEGVCIHGLIDYFINTPLILNNKKSRTVRHLSHRSRVYIASIKYIKYGACHYEWPSYADEMLEKL